MINDRDAAAEQTENVRKIYRRRTISILLFLLIGPLIAGIQRIAESNQIIIVATVLGIFVVGYYLFFVAFVKCPRCNNHFFSKWYGSIGFSMRCVHCGLEGKK